MGFAFVLHTMPLSIIVSAVMVEFAVKVMLVAAILLPVAVILEAVMAGGFADGVVPASSPIAVAGELQVWTKIKLAIKHNNIMFNLFFNIFDFIIFFSFVGEFPLQPLF